MKIAEGFLLKSIAGTNVVVPTGSNTVSFGNVITLNETGVFLWELLENDTTEENLVASMLKEFAIDEATAKSDVAEFVGKLKEAGLLI